MSRYLLLEKVKIQNANCIAGLTYGFPAISHFLGFTHALSRKLVPDFGIELTGCAVVCHQHQVQAYQPDGRGDYIFALTRNPLTKEGNTSPIVEEGRMHLTVSLIIECKGILDAAAVARFTEAVASQSYRQRLAGGQIVDLHKVIVFADDDIASLSRQVMRKVLPGFVLADRSSLLKQHYAQQKLLNPDTTMLDAWLDFAALKYQAVQPTATGAAAAEPQKVLWQYQPKPAPGYLVPITTGYKAISPLYQPGTVANSRDPQSPFCFVESAYGVGEWLSPHRINNLADVIWRYQHSDGWYICGTNGQQINPQLHPEQEILLEDETEMTY